MVVDRQEEAGHERVVGWNSGAMTEKDAKPVENLLMESAKERAQIDAKCTEDEVEQQAAWCQEAISSVHDAMAKKNSICASSKRCWNADIKEQRRRVGRERTNRQNSEDAAQAKAELRKSIRQSKRNM